MSTVLITKDDEINFEATGVELILQNISNILRTNLGENALNRDIGMDNTMLDSSLLKAKAKYIDSVIAQIEEYEDDVELVGVTFTAEPLSGILYPVVEVKIIE